MTAYGSVVFAFLFLGFALVMSALAALFLTYRERPVIWLFISGICSVTISIFLGFLASVLQLVQG